MQDTDTAALEAALDRNIHDAARAIEETVRTLDALGGALELGRRELGRQAEQLRELSPGIQAQK
jgi:hypothetical protein